MKIRRIASLSILTLLFSILSLPAKAETPITGTEVEIIYGFTGRNGANPYAAIGYQIWNPTDRYGFAWIKSTSSGITDADLTALTPGSHVVGSSGRTQNNGNDGSQGFDRWEWNYSGDNFATTFYWKVAILHSDGTLLASSSEVSFSITDPGEPSDGLANMPVFEPVGGINPYAAGGIFYQEPDPPTISDTNLNAGVIEVELSFPVPEEISNIEFSTDGGSTWEEGTFEATAFGSIVGTLSISTESDGSALTSGANYTLQIRGRNNSTNGQARTLTCFTYTSSLLGACSSGSGSSGGGGGGGSSSTTVAPVTIPLTTSTQTNTRALKTRVRLSKIESLADFTVKPGQRLQIGIKKSSKGQCSISNGRVVATTAGDCVVRVTKFTKNGKKIKRFVTINYSQSMKIGT